MPVQDMRPSLPGRDDSLDTASLMPPASPSRNTSPKKATKVKSRNIIVSVMITPRVPAYRVNPV